MIHAQGCFVAHNTAILLNPAPGLTWGMEARFSDSQGSFMYNLTNMGIWSDRDDANGTATGNVTNAQTSWFVNASAGDLHLLSAASAAIDQWCEQIGRYRGQPVIEQIYDLFVCGTEPTGQTNAGETIGNGCGYPLVCRLQLQPCSAYVWASFEQAALKPGRR